MLGKTGETGEKRFSESQSCRKRRHDEVAPEWVEEKIRQACCSICLLIVALLLALSF